MIPNKKQEANKQLWKYASLGGQFLVSIGISLFAGLKADEWLNVSFPLLVWALPLLIIVGIIIKLIIDTGKK